MKKKIIIQAFLLAISVAIAGCGSGAGVNANDTEETNVTATEATVVEEDKDDSLTETENASADESDVIDEAMLELEDGSYLVKFDTDSTMFHVNEMMEGRALLTVDGGKGNLHLIMPSKNVLNLYSGLAADAENDKDNWIEPLVEEVTYDDGMTEEVFVFDVPVYVLNEEFDLALIGKKNVWYDHKVSISDPQAVDSEESRETKVEASEEQSEGTIEVSLEGGTGKVHLTSPTKLEKNQEGYLVTIEWSSKNYDYMIVDDVKYLPVAVEETSVYEIPVKSIEEPLKVIADTVAMSEPHEIEYTITFDTNSMK